MLGSSKEESFFKHKNFLNLLCVPYILTYHVWNSFWIFCHFPAGREPSSNSKRSDKTNSEDESWNKSGNGSKLVTILNPFDKKVKELRTLKQHYYPEGGWGWVIVLVTLCVQLISHGLQYALAMYILAVPKSSVISRRLLNASFDQSGIVP